MSKTIKRIAFTICTILFCISDQRIASTTGDTHLIFSALPALVLGFLILFHYSFRDFLKIPYYILAGIWLFLFPAGLKWGMGNTYYHGQWTMHLSIIAVFSFVLLRTVYLYFVEKKRPSSSPFLLITFAVMIVLMYTSRYDYKWTMFYILLFMFLYLTNFSAEDRNILLFSLQDGIIIAFFLIQGTAFMFRPYDTLRYLGQYANTNMNALFYQSVYCAFLSRFCTMETASEDKKAGFHVLKWICFLFAACMWPFVLLTMCRSAMMGMGIATLLGFAYCIRHARKRKILKSVKYFASLAILMAAGFPVVYCAARYLPPLFHHPVYYVDEYSEEKILYNDPWDSPKYTDWKDILTENFGRIMDIVNLPDQSDPDRQTISQPGADPETTPGGDTETIDQNDSKQYVENINMDDTRTKEILPVNAEAADPVATDPDDVNSGTGGQEQEEAGIPVNSTSIRILIYNYYFHALNWNGHKEAEHGIQLPDNYFAPHAHNLLLQLSFNYGIPFGILFLLLIAASGIKLLVDSFSGRLPGKQIIPLMFFSSILLFGMTEVMWRNGQLSYALLFILPFIAWQSKGDTSALNDHVSVMEEDTTKILEETEEITEPLPEELDQNVSLN